VTGEPLAVRLPPRAEFEPTLTLPKARVVGETAKVPAAVPVPDNGIESGELDALEVMEIDPLAEPAVVGVKVAVKVTLWLALRLRGRVRPVIENPVPLGVAAGIVTVDPPVLVRVSERFVLLPTCTLPKARLVGFDASVPCVTPVPDSAMLKLGFDPLEVMLTLPLAAPAVVGANFTENDVL
jgi:hypothetical protein